MIIRHRYSFLLLAGLLAGCIGVLAGANLWYLRQLHGRSLHAEAARSVLDLGTELARHLAAQPAVQSTHDEAQQWTDFGRLIRALKRVEPSLQYVAVTEGGLTLFQEDVSAATNEVDQGPVQVGRQLLGAREGVVPILTFSVSIPDVTGIPRTVRVAMRKEAVEQREEQAAAMLCIMFRLSLGTLAVSFGLAVVLALWVFRQEMERQRRRQNEEQLAFAGLMADGIIHDVRNPMNSLRLDIQMIEKETSKGADSQPHRIAQLAERARKTMDRMDRVMREFLYVSKPDTRSPEPFDLNTCVHDCIDLLLPRFERAGVRLESPLTTDPLPMQGHVMALKRALINVLTNANQASPSGHTVRIATVKDGKDGVITVDDEGPGIDSQDLKRIFEMFVTGRPDGIGLGLHLAKLAVESCGGTITAENRHEGGARFTLRLPLH